ncbi:MAG TPA: helix-turn-helix domain-containing protein [Thermoanaerobaculaceae bacterium]|nr:helix-turn-helix domain-containing protein [Thermoanaerobaculaceae bacterium]
MKPFDRLSACELLGVGPGASADEIRRAYDTLSARLAPGSLALYSVAERDEQLALQQRLRAAYLELLDGLDRAGDSPGTAQPGQAGAGVSADGAAPAPSGGVATEAVAPSPEPGGEFTGERLRRTREETGISLEALSHRTRIRRQLLEAIEAERFGELPQRVFVRGFVFAVARELGLDPERVWTDYGRRWEASSFAKRSP